MKLIRLIALIATLFAGTLLLAAQCTDMPRWSEYDINHYFSFYSD